MYISASELNSNEPEIGMEDGDNTDATVFTKVNTENACVLPDMANYPDIELTVIKSKNSTETTTTKVNGESENKDGLENEEEEEDSSDEDALVIDEDYKSSKHASPVSRKRLLSPSSRSVFKGFKKRMLRRSTEVLKIVNDCISAVESSDIERITSEEKCDRFDESISQGESCKIKSQEALTKNVNNYTEIPIKGDNETPSLVLNPLNALTEGNTQNTTPIVTKTTEKFTESDLIDEILQNKNIQDIKVSQTECNETCKLKSLTLPKKNPQKPSKNLTNKKIPSPKLTEYAQYLGLQPTVKFKCYKCSESSFPSMSALNEHQHQCLAQPPKANPSVSQTPTPASTNFRVTRKVYLCSACGTYYENWNLFLHMREVHRRFICLYCLGMFSFVEKLTQHLISKHNCAPTSYLSADEYLSSSKDSCFLMCCHCEKVFTEQDNFFEHTCTERSTSSDKVCWSCGIKGSSPHLVSCKASIEQPAQKSSKSTKKSTNEQDNLSENIAAEICWSCGSKNLNSHLPTCKAGFEQPTTSNQKSSKSKVSKQKSKRNFTNIEHVTADSPSKPLLSQPEQTCDIANLCTVDMESPIKSEPASPEKSPYNQSPEEPQENIEEPEIQENVDTYVSTNPNDKEDSQDDEEYEKLSRDDRSVERENFSELEQEQEDDSCNEEISQSDEKESEQQSKEPDAEIPTENFDPDVTTETNVNETFADTPYSEDNSVDLPQTDSDRHPSVSEPEMDVENPEPENPEPMETEDNTEQEEVRRVPKVTLKLPPPGTFSDNESDDSEKLTMEVDENEESEQDCEESQECQENNQNETSLEKPVNGFNEESCEENEKPQNESSESEGLPIAGEDVSIIELELDQPLDKFTTENLLKTCLNATIPICIYCNHARKIAVNGKQLGLHAIAEHRFAATVNSITAEELIPYSFVVRIRNGLDELENKYFNLEIKADEEKEEQPNENAFKRQYECFQCRYITAIHKELYLHNRKMHAKTILLCIMCKSNFYSYSELICHLCPGDYVLNTEMKFRCCMCDIPDLPSAFRLMVHLRKRHHTCDVCLEGCQNQSRLSNHVWKHKLHHLCYRCGIAYRNKPDITKHLFWKHGTESVLCKKCLQKKWPHVYHFCIPPTAFVCEECNLSFSRAVYLKVHKRLHSNEKKHSCTEENCTESFISKKLLLKHEKKHREPEPIPEKPQELVNGDLSLENENKPESLDKEISNEKKEECEENLKDDKEETKKNIIDVYDLPALNLSESDSSDTEDEAPKPLKPPEETPKEEPETSAALPDIEPLQTAPEPAEEEQKPIQVDGIWENFKQYQATIEKRDGINIENKDTNDDVKDEVENKETELTPKKEEQEMVKCTTPEIKEPLSEVQEEIPPDLEVIMVDHDYCIPSPERKDKKDESKMDHDYCTVNQTTSAEVEAKVAEPTKKVKEKKKTSSSSDSSSDSDSSSCTCGSNCSCSSSSGSSSSSSSSSDSESTSSEGKRRIAARRERRKERAKRKKESETSQAASNNSAVDVVATEDTPTAPPILELPIEESDLDTDETETDEDFYDEHPQRLANKILEEKRNQLLMLAGVTPPVSNGSIIECSRPSTPSIPEETPVKKKVKSKKRKKKSRSSTPKQEVTQNIPYQNHQPSPLAIQPPITPIIPVNQPVSSPISVPQRLTTPEIPKPPQTGSGSETDSTVRSSKRRRVPNKFYGYSSDEETTEKPPAPPILKWRKADLPSTPTTTVTPTPKFVPPITIKNIPSPAPVIEPSHAPVVHHTEIRESDSETETQQRKSTSDSSDSNRNEDSDSDGGQLHISQPQFPAIQQVQRTNENLYCYCQCPYDEVSEMIACDGRDCAIEWFHFECVGIMVPPKGKWFCPDCRKKAAMRSDYLQM